MRASSRRRKKRGRLCQSTSSTQDETGACFVNWRGPVLAALVRAPPGQQLRLQAAVEITALACCPINTIALSEDIGDALLLLQDGAPRCLGWVSS